MPQSRDLVLRLAEYYDGTSCAEIENILARVAATPSNTWNFEWVNLLWPGLPHGLEMEVRRLARRGPLPIERSAGPLRELRDRFSEHRIDAFLVPNSDGHQVHDVLGHARG